MNSLPEDIRKELEDYELVEDYSTLAKYDRIKYIRKDTGEFKKGGLIVGSSKDRYLKISSYNRNPNTGQRFIYLVDIDKIILFKKKK